MDTNPYQPPQAEILVPPDVSDAVTIRKAHINHEASVKSVGTLFLLGGLLFVIAGVTAFGGRPNDSLAVRVLIGAAFLLFAGVLLAVAFGVRGLKSWARIPTAILSGLGLVAFPVGTVIGAYMMYLVLCRKGRTVFADDYKLIVMKTPHVKYRTSIVVWIVLGLVIALILGSILWS